MACIGRFCLWLFLGGLMFSCQKQTDSEPALGLRLTNTDVEGLPTNHHLSSVLKLNITAEDVAIVEPRRVDSLPESCSLFSDLMVPAQSYEERPDLYIWSLIALYAGAMKPQGDVTALQLEYHGGFEHLISEIRRITDEHEVAIIELELQQSFSPAPVGDSIIIEQNFRFEIPEKNLLLELIGKQTHNGEDVEGSIWTLFALHWPE